jgi:ribosomal protein S18 acetylase RimI-like enzyme
VIRPGTAADAEAVARVHVETWQAAYAHVLPRDELMALSVESRAEMHRRNPPLVAEFEGEVVGFVAVGRTHDLDGDGELFAIYVHPDNWCSGFGSALIEAGEQRLRELGHRDAHLWVLDDNPRARRFYELAGWVDDGVARTLNVFGFDVTEARYSKKL